jgi:hypothetical protein
MESSTPPLATANPGLDNQAIAQDPLALPNEHHVGYPTNSTESQDQPTTTTTQSNTNNSSSDKNLDGSMTTNTNSNNNGAIYSNNGGAESSHHQGMQYDTATTAGQIGNSHHQHFNDVRQLNHLHQHMSMPQQQHETHKTFSHSIENLSKTTEKCPSNNDMKM